MIRNLEPDELVWFMRQALTFVGHADPHGLSLRLNARLKDAVADAERCFVYAPDAGPPTAGVYLQAEGGGNAVKGAHLASVWHDGAPAALLGLVESLLDQVEPEVVTVPLHLLPKSRSGELEGLLAPLGFRRDGLTRLKFELTDVPPLGSPLVLEAWAPADEGAFRDLFDDCEGASVSDARWSFMKRSGGPFQPDLWFTAREGLDQETVGYAFLGSTAREVDSAYELTSVGVRRRHRENSEMLRRLVLTALREISGRSPVGTVNTLLGASDPKLVSILTSLGFEALERTPVLIKRPA